MMPSPIMMEVTMAGVELKWTNENNTIPAKKSRK
jgi:hypothetical protein